MRKESYNKYLFGGFSAGCNELLKSIMEHDFPCNKLILLSPWISMIEKNLQRITGILTLRGIEVSIICGKNDEECFPLAKKLSQSLCESGSSAYTLYLDNVGYEVPQNLQKILKNHI